MKKILLLITLVLGFSFGQLAEGIMETTNVQKAFLVDSLGRMIAAPVTDQGLTTISTNYTEVLSSSTQILTANTSREYVAITNTGSTILYLAFGNDAVSGNGIYLVASGGSYEMSGDNLYLGAIYGISSASLNVTWAEGI